MPLFVILTLLFVIPALPIVILMPLFVILTPLFVIPGLTRDLIAGSP